MFKNRIWLDVGVIRNMLVFSWPNFKTWAISGKKEAKRSVEMCSKGWWRLKKKKQQSNGNEMRNQRSPWYGGTNGRTCG